MFQVNCLGWPWHDLDHSKHASRITFIIVHQLYYRLLYVICIQCTLCINLFSAKIGLEIHKSQSVSRRDIHLTSFDATAQPEDASLSACVDSMQVLTQYCLEPWGFVLQGKANVQKYHSDIDISPQLREDPWRESISVFPLERISCALTQF